MYFYSRKDPFSRKIPISQFVIENLTTLLSVLLFLHRRHFDEEDYLESNFVDKLDNEYDVSFLDNTEHIEAGKSTKRGRKGGAHGRFHRPRRKQKRRKPRPLEPEGVKIEVQDPDDLPPRARWTIMATAFILLAMSLILVGVTLRMAPIIDEMGELSILSTCIWAIPPKYSFFCILKITQFTICHDY